MPNTPDDLEWARTAVAAMLARVNLCIAMWRELGVDQEGT
jgi:hypothetical protein